MTKQELIDKIAQDADITKKDAASVFSAITDGIADALKAEGRMALAGLGTFRTVERKERTGRNPATGEEIKIKASKNVGFKAAPKLKEDI